MNETIRARGPQSGADFLDGAIAEKNLPEASDLGPRLQEDVSSSSSSSGPGGTVGTGGGPGVSVCS